MSKKTLHNSDISGAHKNVSDLKTYGDGDLWHLLCKASSDSEGWMKSTKIMEIRQRIAYDTSVTGCLVQVTTQQGDHVAEALTYIPGVRISHDGERLVASL